MEKIKKKYIAPEVVAIAIETNATILAASHIDKPIEEDVEVVSMGQEIETDWNFTWEN